MGIENVFFVGFISDRELAILYREAMCYFVPSLYEGFGLPGLEALVHGLPVVAARAGALPEILARAACYFDPEDQASAIDLLKRVEKDMSFRSHLIQNGYRRVAEFSWDHMASLTLRGYHEGESITV